MSGRLRAHTHHSCAYGPYIMRYNTMRSIGIYTRNGNGLLVIRLFKLWLMYVFRLRQTNELEIIFLSTFGHLASLFWIWQYITLGLIWSQRLPVCVCAFGSISFLMDSYAVWLWCALARWLCTFRVCVFVCFCCHLYRAVASFALLAIRSFYAWMHW